MTKLNGWKMAFGVAAFCAATTIGVTAQVFTTVLSFDETDGAGPQAPLVQGSDGSLYGTTVEGGVFNDLCGAGCGTIFRLAPEGRHQTLHAFCDQDDCLDGNYPLAGLIQGSDGNLYGVTGDGGGSPNCYLGCGTVFKISTAGEFLTIYSFGLSNVSDGDYPRGPLLQATDGNFYGTTQGGGAGGGGTIFRITAGGKLTTLYGFCQGNCPDGAQPVSGVIQGTDGNFYGTTSHGGGGPCANGGCGTIFKMTPEGRLTTLHSFQGNDGWWPYSGLVQANDGAFYGTTLQGGPYSSGNVFKITAGGAFTVLYNFNCQTNCADAAGPSGLIQATDGNFYGTASVGGPEGNYGTVFTLTPTGTLTTLYSFGSQAGAGGAYPAAALIQATSGTFYGTTMIGGTGDEGTVFSLSVGLGSFVSLPRSSGKVGIQAFVLGQGLTGTTNVSFNGTAAKFTVGADTYLRATVPTGATTGSVTVTTPSGVLASNVPFRVTPQLLSFSPPSGPVGTVVTITGVSLTQASGVGFGDYVPANFTVNSDLQVTATVPAGAKTGPIGVQTLGGTAISSAVFTVTP